MELTAQQRLAFQETLWEQYRLHGRPSLPWRLPEPDGTFGSYKIMVSELMLQQTQAARAALKYQEFLERFPDLQSLAAANLGNVLRVWQGLGYNRRAKYLWLAAQEVVRLKHFPATQAELVKLPGIGPNTAGAILAYAFNLPSVFIETNIRTVYIHHFFQDESEVGDKAILPLIEQTLEREHPREFYWALMDYGSFLKTAVGNLNVASKHYAKQSRFEGSQRQLRGQVIRLLSVRAYTAEELLETITDVRLPAVLQELEREALIRENKGVYGLE